jgi:uncharacterized protein
MDASRNNRQVGRVVGLWRYPVKSMGGEALSEVDVPWHGFAGDRRWAFIRNGVARSGFPWLTLRERGDLSHFVPSFVERDRPDESALIVRTPEGVDHEVDAPALAAHLAPDGVRLIKQDRGIFDAFPLSLVSTRTLTQLSDSVGLPLDVQRFRPNILVDVAADEGESPEDAWVGRVVRVGAMRMRVDKRDGRCVVITIDPVTTVRNPLVLRTVARERQGFVGVYGSTVEPGRIAMNDAVIIEAPA